VGRLRYGTIDVAIGTMGFMHEAVDTQEIKRPWKKFLVIF